MTNIIHTIGYEGSSIEDFIATLVISKISTLIDIRELPLSRKKGFSKNILAEILNKHGIKYVHLRGLGDPKEGRDAARSGDHEKFLRIFKKHMKSDIAQTDLKKAEDIAISESSCLLCFEREPKCCHRNIVVNELIENTGQSIKHLGVRKDSWTEIEFYAENEHEFA